MLKGKIEKIIKQVTRFVIRRKKEVCIATSSVVLLGGIGVGLACMGSSADQGVSNNSKVEHNENNDNEDKKDIENDKAVVDGVDGNELAMATSVGSDSTNSTENTDTNLSETSSNGGNSNTGSDSSSNSNSGSTGSSVSNSPSSSEGVENNAPANGTSSPNSGGSTSSKPSTSNSSANNNNTNNKPSSKPNTPNKTETPSAPSTSVDDEHNHVHNWVPITEVRHHIEEGHWENVIVKPSWVEEIPVYEEKPLSICNGCGKDITGHVHEHMESQALAGKFECGGYHVEYKQVQTGTNKVTHQAVTEQKWIVDKAGWNETVVIGYKCSICGKIK